MENNSDPESSHSYRLQEETHSPGIPFRPLSPLHLHPSNVNHYNDTSSHISNVGHFSQRALSPTLSMMNEVIQDLNKDIHVSKWKHIFRTVFVFFILVIVGYFMTNIQVLVDNEALSYFYGVTTRDQWADFNNSMHSVAASEKLSKRFPNILIKKDFGGYGENGKIEDNSANQTYQALLLDDIIFRNYDWNYSKIKLLADVLCLLYCIVTVIFLLILPYFDSFKTTVRKKLKKSIKHQEASVRLMPKGSLHFTSSSSQETQCKEPEEPPSTLDQLESQPPPFSQKFLKSIFLFPSRYIHGLVFVRRLIIILAFNYFFRALVVGVTIFPQESTACIPVLRLSLGEKLYGAFVMITGVETACHDFIYSGHTAISTILAWFWIIYSSHALFHPRRYFIDLGSQISSTRVLSRVIKKRKRSTTSSIIVWLIRSMALIYLVVIAVCLVISRIHYTVDVALGFLVGSLIFWLWHALVTLYYYFKFKSHILDYVDVTFQSLTMTTIPTDDRHTELTSKNLDPKEEKLRANREVRDILVPIKRTNMALNFVGWIDGYDLYVKDNIGFCSPDSHILPFATDSRIDLHSDIEDSSSSLDANFS